MTHLRLVLSDDAQTAGAAGASRRVHRLADGGSRTGSPSAPVDDRPWCPEIPDRLTLPVQPTELLCAEFYARGLIGMAGLLAGCGGSQVRAGLALDMWIGDDGGGAG